MRPVERDTEILIDTQLRNLGWESDPHSAKRNVYVHRVKTEQQRKRLQGGIPDYTLYASTSDEPIAIIEAKRPGKSIHQALDQGLRYAQCLDVPVVFATDGIFTKTIHAIENKPLRLNGEEVDELLREALALRYLVTHDVSTLDKRVVKSRSELIGIFDTVNDRLREEGLQQGLERFTEFSNILFLKVLSEIEDAREEAGEQSKIDRAYRWESFRDKKGPELLSYVTDTVLQWFAHAYQDAEIFQPLQIKHPDNLKQIINRLDDLQLTDINADVKGDAFEYFIRSYSASNPSDLGEIFTPRHIVKTVVKLLNPEIGETIYDPFCGTGGMLIVAFKHIMANMVHSPGNVDRLQRATVYGADLTKSASIAKMNMILAGDGHNNVARRDSLANPVDNQYDTVITNMPFAQTTRYGDKYTVASQNGDVICPQHCFRAVKPGGRIAMIVPEGFLSNSSTKAFRDVRKYLLDNAVLRSVVSLPRGAFEPYNRAKANILYFTDVQQTKTKGHYWYFDVRNDGYTLDKRRRPIEGGNDLELVLSENNLEKQTSEYLGKIGVVRIDVGQVQRNNYALNAAHYREVVDYDALQYETLTFGDLFEPSGGDRIGDDNDAPIMSMTMANGLVDQSEKFNKRIASADISGYRKVYRGELVVGFPVDEGTLGFQTKYDYAAVSPAYKVWKLRRHDIDMRFLEMMLRSQQMREVYLVKTASPVDRRRIIDGDVLLGIRIPIPPPPVQRAIVEKQEAIDKASKVIQKLEQGIAEGFAAIWKPADD